VAEELNIDKFTAEAEELKETVQKEIETPRGLREPAVIALLTQVLSLLGEIVATISISHSDYRWVTKSVGPMGQGGVPTYEEKNESKDGN